MSLSITHENFKFGSYGEKFKLMKILFFFHFLSVIVGRLNRISQSVKNYLGHLLRVGFMLFLSSHLIKFIDKTSCQQQHNSIHRQTTTLTKPLSLYYFALYI